MENFLHKLPIFSLPILLSFFLTYQSVCAQSFSKTLIPDQVGIQYAGSIGYMSLGLGYNLLKEKSTLSFHYGYVPRIKGGELHIGAIKFDYKPFAIHLGNKVIIHPLNPAFFLSYTFGKQFGLKFDSDQYSKGYYFWSPALREHIALSTEIKILGDSGSKIKSISLYTEANTNDLYLISWYENRTSTPIQDIFHLGFGLKMNF